MFPREVEHDNPTLGCANVVIVATPRFKGSCVEPPIRREFLSATGGEFA